MIINRIQISPTGFPFLSDADRVRQLSPDKVGVEITLFNNGTQVWQISTVTSPSEYYHAFDESVLTGGSGDVFAFGYNKSLGLSANTALISFYSKYPNNGLKVTFKGIEKKEVVLSAPSENMWHTKSFNLPADITQEVIDKIAPYIPIPQVGTQIDINAEVARFVEASKHTSNTSGSGILPDLTPTLPQPESKANLILAIIGIASLVFLAFRKRKK